MADGGGEGGECAAGRGGVLCYRAMAMGEDDDVCVVEDRIEVGDDDG